MFSLCFGSFLLPLGAFWLSAIRLLAAVRTVSMHEDTLISSVSFFVEDSLPAGFGCNPQAPNPKPQACAGPGLAIQACRPVSFHSWRLPHFGSASMCDEALSPRRGSQDGRRQSAFSMSFLPDFVSWCGYCHLWRKPALSACSRHVHVVPTAS